MRYTIPITLLTRNNVPSAGGKGANLGELAAAGFPIPPGFILTTGAYEAFLNENGIQQQIIDLALKVSFNDPLSGEKASKAIKKLFLSAEIPETVQIDLLSAYADLTVKGGTAIAVRSSATTEDLPSASYAGQLDTFLNITGDVALLDAVRKCWASLWTARAISYRLHQEVDPADVSLAVVVQQLIPADCSGILFTANPISGEREQIVINAAWGLGEAIVSGQVTPDAVVVNKLNQQIISRETTTKAFMTVCTDSGTEKQSVPTLQKDQPVIDDTIAIELARYGAMIEVHYGMPMDIEWAICAGNISILQARPITNLPEAPLRDVRWEPLRPGSVWMRRQVVEHMPEPLSPLFDELYLQEGLDGSMQSFADFMSELSGLKFDIWEIIPPPFATTINGYAYSIASFEISRKFIPFVFRVYIVVLPKMIRHLFPRWRDESLPAYRTTIAYWKSIDLAKTPDEDLLQGIRKLAYEDAVYWFAAAVPLGLARITDSVLDYFLKAIVSRGRRSGEPRLTSGAYLRGFPSKSVEAQVQLEAIARTINRTESLREQFLDAPIPESMQTLAEHPEGQKAMSDLRKYLDTYGHQVYNLDFAAPTLADDPVPVLLSLKTAVKFPDRDARVRQAEMTQEREDLVMHNEKSLNPILRPVFRRLLIWAQRYAPVREEALFYVGAAWPALRRLAFELGQRLTEAGSLNFPDDIFYLRTDELTTASVARAKGLGRPELARLAQDRRALREARKRLDPPMVVPLDGRMKFGPIDMAMFEPKPRSASSGSTIEGFAVSPGQVTALASVIRSPEDFENMQPDTILVCTTTTPAWTPLFAQAKGLVTDIGGALAHGSIVAREYGIPAVMGTGVATHRIKNGQRILVDGDAGTVTLVDEVDALAKMQPVGPSTVRKKAILALVVGIVAVIFWWKRRRTQR